MQPARRSTGLALGTLSVDSGSVEVWRTWSVHTLPSQKRATWRPVGSEYQPGAAAPDSARPRSVDIAFRFLTSSTVVQISPNGKPHHPSTMLYINTPLY